MKKIISIALLFVLLMGVMVIPEGAFADSLSSYNGNTSYARWYFVSGTKNHLSINSKPENSSHEGVSRNGKAYNGDSVYITDAQAGAGTAKKWGRVTKVMDHKTGAVRDVNGYACMYYLSTKPAPNPNPNPVSETKTIRKSNVILDKDIYIGSMKVTDEMTVVINTATGKIVQNSCNSYFSQSGLGGLFSVKSKIYAYNVQNTFVEFEAIHTLSGSVSIFHELGLNNQDTFVCHYRLDNQGNLTKLDAYWR